ncbi:MAG: sel1 repeat family protein [Gammaproteobacteria bacterium]|nr:MAG: sel1 repeat family protein [Gammaproteobacteria bacterium]
MKKKIHNLLLFCLSLTCFFVLCTDVVNAKKIAYSMDKAEQRDLLKDAEFAIKRKEYSKAIEYLTILSKQGNPQAKYLLGTLYEQGLGVGRNVQTAKYLYDESAESGYYLSQYHLGLIYFKGKGGTKQPLLAIELFEKAANQGYSKAQFALAKIYLKGTNGVDISYSKAIPLLQELVKKGDDFSQYELGLVYLHGKGLEEDNNKALQLMQLAARQGNKKAQNRLRDIKLFRNNLNEAEKGGKKAQFIVAENYYFGKGTKTSAEKALVWYRKSAEQGYAKAQFVVGKMYETGNGVDQNIHMAAKMYSLAAEKNHADAQYEYGLMFTRGGVVDIDVNKAIFWMEKADANGSEKSGCSLGHLYYYGNLGRASLPKGEGRNIDLAKKWYSKTNKKICPEKHSFLLRYGK